MKTIIEMAREAGLRDCTCDGTKGCLERFASLVRADDREQRTWVGLTDEEITDIWAEASPYYHEDDFARAIEAKLRSKNEDRN